MFRFLAIAVLLVSTQAFATDSECRQTFRDDMRECINDLFSLPPKMRAGAMKGCVKEAKRAKQQCLSGPSACEMACEATYDSSELLCQQAYDAGIATCGGNFSCENFYTQQRADCIAAAASVLDSCTASCE